MLKTMSVTLAAFLLLTSCGGDSPSGPGNTGPTIGVRDNFFQPVTLTVDVNETVRWVWNSSGSHNVTFDAGGPNSTTRSSGTFERAFAEAGTYTFYCTVHGRSQMAGSVTVQEASGG